MQYRRDLSAGMFTSSPAKPTKKSRKRKRSDLSNSALSECESPRKKRKLKHLNSELSSIGICSNLFSHVLDEERFRDIFTAIYQSSLGQAHVIPSAIVVEISEYATGSLRKCHNHKHCNNTILTLHEYNVISDFALERTMNQIAGPNFLQRAAESAVDKIKYFRCLPHYFCIECIKNGNGLRICSVCNQDATTNTSKCDCGHTLIYCNKCIKHCSYCGDIQVCNKRDDTKPMFSSLDCHRIIKCQQCKSRMCTGNKKKIRKCRACRARKKN